MKKQKILSIILIIFFTIILISLCSILIYVNMTLKDVKDLELNIDKKIAYTQIFDKNNNDILNNTNLKSNYITIDKIPDITKQAFISIEDKNFYDHKGINYKRIIKAAFNNLKSKSFKEGASTITQQLIKNRYLSNEKTINRKLKEIYLSKKLEKTTDKNKILEVYLNTIYFGNGAYGIGNASNVFFGKNVEKLNLVESATLAGIIKSPSKYSPINDYQMSTNRKNLVIKEMFEDKVISKEEYHKSLNEKINLDNSNPDYVKNDFDLYTKYVLNEASEKLKIDTENLLYGGYKIYTYQDSKIQKILDSKINDEKYYIKNNSNKIADSLSIIIDNETNSVSAISGKSEYDLVNIKRQPGSLIKPIMVYMPALEKGMINAKTQVLDEPININGYSPKNVGNVNYGYVSIEDSVAKSLNIPTIKLAEKLGIEECKKYAQQTGIKFNDEYDNNYAITLGGFRDGVTLKEITDSYSVLNNDGFYVKSDFIEKIKNNMNMTIYNRNLTRTKVYNDDTIYLMTNILKYSVKNGTSKNLSKLQFDVAGKTGTVGIKNTNFNTDAYSLAYTTKHTMSVWFGNYTMKNEYKLIGKNNGGTSATKIINDTFNEVYKYDKPPNFKVPNSVEKLIIDNKTLEDEHIVVLGNNVPKRYQIESYFSKRFSPKISSKKFDIIEPINFSITKNKNSLTIKLNVKDYQNYSIFKIVDGKESLLKSINNSSGITSIVDKNLQPNKTHYYYIKVNSDYNDDEFVTLKKSIFHKKDYDSIIENNNNDYSWIF